MPSRLIRSASSPVAPRPKPFVTRPPPRLVLPGDGQGPLRPARRYRLQTDRLRSTRAPDDVTIHGYSQHVNPVIGHRGLDVGGKPNRPLADLGDARPVAIVNSKQSTMWNITILRARLWSVALSPGKCSCHIGNKTQVGLQRLVSLAPNNKVTGPHAAESRSDCTNSGCRSSSSK